MILKYPAYYLMHHELILVHKFISSTDMLYSEHKNNYMQDIYHRILSPNHITYAILLKSVEDLSQLERIIYGVPDEIRS